MNIVLHKQISSVVPTSIDGDIKFPSNYEQRIPSYEMSLLTTNHSEEVGSSPPANQATTAGNFNSSQATPNDNADMNSSYERSDASNLNGQSPSIVPTTAVRSASRIDMNSYCGVIFQDHNYGAPMPYQSNVSSISICLENDDLPKLIVPIAQPAKNILTEPAVTSVQDSNECNISASVMESRNVSEKPVAPKMTKKQKEIAAHEACSHYGGADVIKPKVGGTRCICEFSHDDGYMIQCECCTTWQHVVCFQLSKENLKKSYFCEVCYPRDVNRARAISIQQRKLDSGKIKGQKHKKDGKKAEEKKSLFVSEKERKKLVSPKEPISSAPKAPPMTVKALDSAPVIGHPDSILHPTESTSASISREERKLLAIIKQFEKLEKKTKDKSEIPESGNSAVPHVPVKKNAVVTSNGDISSSPNIRGRNSGIRPTLSGVVKKNNSQGLTTMMKKRSKKAVSNLQNKINRSKVSSSRRQVPSSISSSSKSSSSEQRPYIRKTPVRKQSPQKSTSNSSVPEGGKKRWLHGPEIESNAQNSTASPNIAYESHPLFGSTSITDNAVNDSHYTAFKGLQLFPNMAYDTRQIDSMPIPVASSPGSPELVVAPLKKRYVRTESSSTPVVEQSFLQNNLVSPIQEVNVESGYQPNLTACLSQSLPQFPFTLPTVLDCSSEKISGHVENDDRLNEMVQDGVPLGNTVPEPEPVVHVEPMPAKRKVSLKEYKQRIREQPESSTNICVSNDVASRSGDGEANNNVSMAVVDVLQQPLSDSPIPQSVNSDLLNVDKDQDDILLKPLPSDFHLSGGLQTIKSSEKAEYNSGGEHANRSSKNRTLGHSYKKHHRLQQQPNSDLRLIIPTKEERMAKLQRVEGWLEDVVKVGDSIDDVDDVLTDLEPTPQNSSSANLVKDSDNIVKQKPELFVDEVTRHTGLLPANTNTTISSAASLVDENVTSPQSSTNGPQIFTSSFFKSESEKL